MASFFFDDYHFPSELYNREIGDFTAPVKTLLDFAPHILQELPKEEKDQKPIHSKAQDSWTKSFLSKSANSYFGSLLSSERTKAVTEFIIRCGNEYMKSASEKSLEEEQFKRFKAEDRKRRRRENDSRWVFNKEEVSSSEEDEEEQAEERMRERMRKENQKKEKAKAQAKERGKEKESTASTDNKQVAKADNSTLVKSAVAASVLSLSLYSTYQASVTFSDILFHNQLELLITQVQSIIQSTEVWIEEHEKMNDKIPSQVRSDLIYIKQLVEDLVRLDPRSNKKVEAAGWGCSALGGLSALGGIAIGSATVATGGAALALGGVIVMISAKAQSAGKSKLGARILLENQVREKAKECQKAAKEREKIIQHEFNIPKREKKVTAEEKSVQVEAKIGDKRKHEERINRPLPEVSKPSIPATKKEKTAVLTS